MSSMLDLIQNYAFDVNEPSFHGKKISVDPKIKIRSVDLNKSKIKADILESTMSGHSLEYL